MEDFDELLLGLLSIVKADITGSCRFRIYRYHWTLSPVHTNNNVETTTFDFVAKNGNIEATFDFVERIVRLVTFDNVTSTLLLMWTGL